MVEHVVIAGTEHLTGLLHDAAASATPVGVRSSSGPARLGRGRAPHGGILADLSAMKRILAISRRDRVAIVEAGVTYAELAPLLAEEGLRLPHPLLPPPGKSVTAAVIDREPSLIPKYHWDMTDPLLCAELCFGTGETFRTGGAAGPGETLEDQWAAGMAQKNPLGPAQTDLIKVVQGSQATMGVATWVSLRCEVAPEIRSTHVVGSDGLAPLAAFVREATRRRLGDEFVLLDAAAAAQLAPTLAAGGAWTCVYSVGSLPYLPSESVEYQLGDLAGVAARVGVGPVDADPAACEQLFGPVGAEPAGPERRVHFLADLGRAAALASVVTMEWAGAAVWVQPLNQGRTAHVEVWAPGAADADADLDLGRRLVAAGAFLHRPHGPFAVAAYEACPDTVAALQKVKALLDPAGILNPGALWTRSALAA